MINTKNEEIKLDYSRVVPSSYLFLGDLNVDVVEDDLKYSYTHLDCFLGNSEIENINSVNIATFMLKQLTGDGAGEMHFPINVNDDFYVVRMLEDGGDECFRILPALLCIGKKQEDFYQIKDIVKYIDKINMKSKLDAKTAAENAKTDGKVQ